MRASRRPQSTPCPRQPSGFQNQTRQKVCPWQSQPKNIVNEYVRKNVNLLLTYRYLFLWELEGFLRKIRR